MADDSAAPRGDNPSGSSAAGAIQPGSAAPGNPPPGDGPAVHRGSIPPWLALILSLAVFGLDRWSKHLVETNLGFFDTRKVIPGFFDIVRSQNAGVAFGLFSQSGFRFRTAILIGFSCVAVLVLAILLSRIRRWDRPTGLGVALVFGGALGNVYDRLHAGTVTDFLDFYIGTYHWYTFNLADTAICIGAGLLILSMLRSPHAA